MSEFLAVTIITNGMPHEEEYAIYTDPVIRGYIVRQVREHLYVTLFMDDDELAVAFCLKYPTYGTVRVPYVPDIALFKTQIEVCCVRSNNTKTITYRGVF